VSGFVAALALLGLVALILARLYAAGRLLAVARPAPPAMPFSGGFPPAEHAVSQFQAREVLPGRGCASCGAAGAARGATRERFSG